MVHSKKNILTVPPPLRKLEVIPLPHPLNTLTVIRNKFFFPSLPSGTNFLQGESADLFWNNPMAKPPKLETPFEENAKSIGNPAGK
jgi:hypothetical protein